MSIQDFVKKYGTDTASLLITRVLERLVEATPPEQLMKLMPLLKETANMAAELKIALASV